MTQPSPYASLQSILAEAYQQASQGKGRERHQRGDAPFDQQPIMTIGRVVGHGFQLGQVMKKTDEAAGMLDRGERQAARRELLGAIVYLAAAVLMIDEGAKR
jgi:hypothetical protein